MNTLKLNWTGLFAFVFALMLFSCQENSNVDLPEDMDLEQVSEDEVYYLTAASGTTEATDQATDFRHRRICLQPVFPLTLVFPNGSTLEVNDLRELKKAFIRWRRSGNDGRPHIAFPHEVELPDGNIVTVENREELRRLIRQCLKKVRPNLDSCYQISFPVTVDLGNGVTETVASKEELAALIRNWAQNQRASLPRPEMVFPIDIVMNDGHIVTVTSARELAQITRDCLPERKKCFEWVYPVTFELPDGRVVIETPREMRKFLLRYAKNGTSDRLPQIHYPQEVTLPNGNVITLENNEDLKALLNRCR